MLTAICHTCTHTFLSGHACENAYVDAAYAEYDHNVIDKFLTNPLLGFPTADPVALGFAFHPAKLLSEFDKQSGGNQIQSRENQEFPRDILIPTAIIGITNLAGIHHVSKNMYAEIVTATTELWAARETSSNMVILIA